MMGAALSPASRDRGGEPALRGAPMHVFSAGLQCETNTFSPFLAGSRAFEEGGILRGEAAVAGPGPDHAAARLWKSLSENGGHRFTASLFALAHPSGLVVHSVYEALRDEILRDLRDARPVDLVLLFLHGAMVTSQGDDCEIDLLRRIRQEAGPDAVIGVELDPHCHLGQPLVDAADVIILMKEYPHDDHLDRARELYEICSAKHRGDIEPVSALFDCRMVGFYPTTEEPMAGLVAKMREAEREQGVLSVSFAHGFAWGDMPDSGSRVLAVCDADSAQAAEVATCIGQAIYRKRRTLQRRFASVEEAVDEALATEGTVVLADLGDNPGGGAPGDNVALLRHMLDRGVRDAVVGAVCDPVAARLCAEAGEGTRLAIRLGGKMGPASGDPLDIEAVVRSCVSNHEQAGLGGSTIRMGLSAWIEVQGIAVAIVSVRAQTFDPSIYSGLGIELSSKKIITVKSSQHFYSRFSPIARKVIWVQTPGALDMDFSKLAYRRKRDLNFFPRVDDPLELDG